jgi:hypothetical protein
VVQDAEFKSTISAAGSFVINAKNEPADDIGITYYISEVAV